MSSTRDVYLITHPDVRVDPQTPVPDWSLSERGLSRMRAGLAQPWIAKLSVVYSSAERKAREGAGVIAERLGASLRVDPDLGEVDRSATGYLPHAEHEATANEMFANPELSARGWEKARDAQQRIVEAIHTLVAGDRTAGSIAIVSHGAVGALLLCHLANLPIDRKHDQPGAGGGNYFQFRYPPGQLVHGWQPFDG
jgi:broad specificity phosphatase PhoE